MARQMQIKPRHKREYWYLVRQCLIKFHGFTKEAAKNRVRRIRRLVGMMDIAYHQEACYTAMEAAGAPLGFELDGEQSAEYTRMRNESIVHCGEES